MPGPLKHEYESFVDPGLCFAQDTFANQFSIKEGTICRFDAETGVLTPVAATVAKWAELIQSNDRLWTGWPIAYRWKRSTDPFPSTSACSRRPPSAAGAAMRSRL